MGNGDVQQRKQLHFEHLESRRVLSAANDLAILGLVEPVRHSIDPETTFAASGHLNDDGFADLVLGSLQGNLEFLFGNGAGAFSVAARLTGLGQINDVAIGTVQADGVADLVVSGTTIVSTVWGSESGSWEVGQQWSGSGVSAVNLLDLNGDEVLDLVTRQADQIETRLGTGENSFHDPVSYAGDRFDDDSRWSDGLEGDLNLDGHVDLVRSAGGGATEVLLNDGQGVFDNVTMLSDLPNPRALRDVNGDDQLDLIVASIDEGRIATIARVEIHLGNGDGTFGEATHQFIMGGSPGNLNVSDVNGDSISDLLVYERVGVHNVMGSGPNVYLGTADGVFQDGIRVANEFGRSIGLAVADVMGNAGVEIIRSEGSELLVQSFSPDPTFSRSAVNYRMSAQNLAHRLVTDINADGHPDLIGAEAFGSNVFIRLGQRRGFGDEQIVSLDGSTNVSRIQLIAGNFTGHSPVQLGILGADEGGVFRMWVIDSSVDPTVASPLTSFIPTAVAPVSFDVDQNGLLDVVFVLQDQLVHYLNQRDGQWQQIVQTLDERPISIETVDANGDPFLDLVLSGRVYQNQSGERFEPWNPNPGRLTDLNQDGSIDVVLATGGETETLAVALSDGNRSWLPAEPIALTIPPNALHLVDVNSDGREDFVFATVTESEQHVLRVAFSDGTNEITEVIDSPFLPPDQYQSLSFRDYNRDGNLDMAADGSFSTDVFLGDGSGTFSAPTELTNPFLVVRRGGYSSMIDVYGDEGVTSYPLPVRSGFSLEAVHFEFDMGDDGDEDIVVSHATGFVLLLGVGPGDFNRDGFLDDKDIDLFHSIEDPSDDEIERFDLTQDGMLDSKDVTFLVEDLAGTRRGDTDFDGDVDFNDYLLLAASFGKSNATWSMGDFDGDGRVAFFDFVVLAIHFGFQKDP